MRLSSLPGGRAPGKDARVGIDGGSGRRARLEAKDQVLRGQVRVGGTGGEGEQISLDHGLVADWAQDGWCIRGIDLDVNRLRSGPRAKIVRGHGFKRVRTWSGSGPKELKRRRSSLADFDVAIEE